MKIKKRIISGNFSFPDEIASGYRIQYKIFGLWFGGNNVFATEQEAIEVANDKKINGKKVVWSN